MSNTPPDSIPSDDELAALQAEIEKAKAEAAQRRPVGKSSGKMSATADMEAALETVAAEGRIPMPEDEDALAIAENRIVELDTELATLKDRAMRTYAEAENIRKRAEREVVNARTYGIEKFAGDMLGVFDNLQRALNSIDEKTREDLGPNAQTLLEGLELTEKTLMAALARHGVTAVSGQGSKFDPNVHQAVANIPSDEDKGNVAEVMQTGFQLGQRTLRAAMVAVSTGPAK